MSGPGRAVRASQHLAFATVVFFGGWLASPTAAQELPDFDAARDEAVAFLQDLIRINTTSPPGNETEVAEYVERVLKYYYQFKNL